MQARSAPLSLSPPGGRAAAPNRRPARVVEIGDRRVELSAAAEMTADLSAWRQLAGRALEAAPFAEPEFVLGAARHLPESRRLALLLVWAEAAGPFARLEAVLPLILPRASLAAASAALWRPPFGAPASLLLDRDAADAALEAAVAGFSALRPGLAGLALADLVPGGRTEAAVAALARRSRRRLDLAPSARRLFTSLREPVAAAVDGTAAAPPAGGWRLERARGLRPVRDAVEEFLALDARAAAAAGGTAVIADTGTASFLRAVTRQLALDRRCRLHLARRDGIAEAAAVVIEGAGRSWLWASARAPGESGRIAMALVRAACGHAQRGRGDLVALVDADEAAGLAGSGTELIDAILSSRARPSPATSTLRIGRRIGKGLRSALRQAQLRLSGAA